jgi:hypothetical protein
VSRLYLSVVVAAAEVLVLLLVSPYALLYALLLMLRGPGTVKVQVVLLTLALLCALWCHQIALGVEIDCDIYEIRKRNTYGVISSGSGVRK